MNQVRERNDRNRPEIREISPQLPTWELCPKCGNACSQKATDYRNTRCWKIACQNCDYLAFETEGKS